MYAIRKSKSKSKSIPPRPNQRFWMGYPAVVNENGNEEPGASAILALSELYGITPNDLLYDDRETIILDIQNLQEDDVEFLINTFSYMRKKNG